MIPAIAKGLIGLAVAALVFAALHDIAFRTIPDWVSTALAADGGLFRFSDHTLPASLVCGAVVFVLAAGCWWRGWLGGGDVKLLTATAVLIPPALVPGYIAVVACCGGALALVYLILERLVPAPRLRLSASLLWRIAIVECRRIRRRTSLPYATAISAAALLMLAGG